MTNREILCNDKLTESEKIIEYSETNNISLEESRNFIKNFYSKEEQEKRIMSYLKSFDYKNDEYGFPIQNDDDNLDEE